LKYQSINPWINPGIPGLTNFSPEKAEIPGLVNASDYVSVSHSLYQRYIRM